MRYAVLFPGQGSQFVGMGADLFARRSDLLGAPADDVLGWSLRDVCLDGPADELTRTEVAQPALYALSYVLWEVLREKVGEAPVAAAGHSLGEYSALAASGALSYFDGLGLVAERGKAMAAAADAAPSGMAALLGADADRAGTLAEQRRAEGGHLWVANVNAPGQVVMAGGSDDLEWLVSHSSEAGARRVVPLQVAGAFHTPYMDEAQERLRRALEAIEFSPLDFPVWSNVTAAPHTDDIRGGLMRQLTATVRFAESLRSIADRGAQAFVHIGPGDVTAGLARRTVTTKTVLVVSEPAAADATAGQLAALVE